MARLLFTLWFALVSLPGPGVCCCTFLVRSFQPAPKAAPAPVKSCCCPDPEPVEPTEEPPARPPCPCKSSISPTYIVTAAAPDEGGSSASEPVLVGQFVASRLPTILVLTTQGDEVLLPFHPTGELLRAHHLLRC